MSLKEQIQRWRHGFRIWFAGDLTDEELKPFAKRPLESFDWRYRCIYRTIQSICGFYAMVIRGARYVGRENIPKGRYDWIAIANHVDNLDPFLVGTALNQISISFMAKKELFTNPKTRMLFHFVATFMVDREKVDITTIRSAKAVVEAPGWVLGIFPEGTRRKDGATASAKGQTKKGAAFLAKTTGASVLPMHIAYNEKKQPTLTIGTLIENTGQSVEEWAEIIEATLDEMRIQNPSDGSSAR